MDSPILDRTNIADKNSYFIFNEGKYQAVNGELPLRQNLFLEGDNLPILNDLLATHKEIFRIIYIDPPYNTRNYLLTYHDNRKSKLWLEMMKDRLKIARDLLSENGVIFTSIDSSEVWNLKLLFDEIFGSENFLGEIIWHNRTTPNDAKSNFACDHEYILCYAKNSNQVVFKGNQKDLDKYKNPDNDPNGPWMIDNPSAASGQENYKFPIVNPFTKQEYFPPKGRYWAFAPARVEQWALSGKLVFPKMLGKKFILKKYLSELKSHHKAFSSVISGILTSHGTKELKQLFDGEGAPLKFPKPTALIKTLLEQLAENEDHILDFFAGSGTTADACIQLEKEKNIKLNWVMIQIPEPVRAGSQGEIMGFKTVSEITKERIKRAYEVSSLK
jgi:adenine-specific DNA-methyltransferase